MSTHHITSQQLALYVMDGLTPPRGTAGAAHRWPLHAALRTGR